MNEPQQPRPHTTASWWKPWFTPAIIIALVGGVAFLGYMVVYRIPDVEKQLERLHSEQKEQATLFEKQQQERFSRIEVQLVNVRTNLVQVCMRLKAPAGTCQVRDLVATISDLSTQQAQVLVSAKVEKLFGRAPAISSVKLQEQLATLKKFPGPVPGANAKEDIAGVMAWSAAADGALWSVDDGSLKVRFRNGSAVFRPVASLTPVRLNLMANELNVVSQAMSSENPNAHTAETKPP